METFKGMDCLEFKRLAMAEPNSKNHAFVEHSRHCAECLRYVGGIRTMDTNLAASVDVAVPPELIARIQLAQELAQAKHARRFWGRPQGIAASVVGILLLAGIALGPFNGWRQSASIEQDYVQLLSGVVEHINEHPMLEVWGNERANQSINAVLDSYDGRLQLRYMESLQFGKICPMGKYQGLHATMDTPEGQITFAYFKGDSVTTLQDITTQGFMARVKPVRGGSLVILSKTVRGLQLADEQLKSAMQWTI